MKFDLERINEKLDELSQRKGGAQPELVLGCFIGRGVDDDGKCINECPNRHNNPRMYEQKCWRYLKGFVVKEVKENRSERG